MQIALLHPGDMGATVAAALVAAGQGVSWIAQGRSANTRARADALGLTALADMHSLARCDVVVSVCPPHAALAQAHDVFAAGFKGLYLDANAIAPQTLGKIADLAAGAGAVLVDGGIIGGVTREPGRTYLYLSGGEAAKAASLFAGSFLGTRVVSDRTGDASALKMCYSAYSKGLDAMLLALLAAAKHYGVDAALAADWAGRQDNPMTRGVKVGAVAGRAWRWAWEMEEIAATFEGAGMPGGFHHAAADIFERLSGFKDSADKPTLEDLVAQVSAYKRDAEGP